MINEIHDHDNRYDLIVISNSFFWFMYYTLGILSNAIYHNNKLTGTNILKSELKNMAVSLNYFSFLLEFFLFLG